MPAVADYTIITDAEFPVDGSARSFAMPSVATGTKSILMFRMYVRYLTGTSALWHQHLIVRINRTQVLKLWVPALATHASTIHEVISESPAIYEQQGNTIEFQAVPNPSYSGDAPLPVIMVSDVVLWFQASV